MLVHSSNKNYCCSVESEFTDDSIQKTALVQGEELLFLADINTQHRSWFCVRLVSAPHTGFHHCGTLLPRHFLFGGIVAAVQPRRSATEQTPMEIFEMNLGSWPATKQGFFLSLISFHSVAQFGLENQRLTRKIRHWTASHTRRHPAGRLQKKCLEGIFPCLDSLVKCRDERKTKHRERNLLVSKTRDHNIHIPLENLWLYWPMCECAYEFVLPDRKRRSHHSRPVPVSKIVSFS